MSPRAGWVWPLLVLAAGAVFGLGAGTAGCGSARPPVTPGVVRVVAGENFWGNIAAQIGGRHARVTSIITSPNADPHLYEADVDARRQPATAQDRRHRTGQALPGGTVE